MSIKDRFVKLPEPLQRQLLRLFVSCLIFLVGFIAVMLAFQNLYLGLSLVLFCLSLGVYTVWLAKRLFTGKYIAVSGICRKIERARFKRGGVILYFSSSEHMIKIRCKLSMKALDPGDTLTMYILEHTPVYENEGCLIPGAFLTLDYKKGCLAHDRSRESSEFTGRTE